METGNRTIDRLYSFIKWCVENKLVHSTRDFEQQCGMGVSYIRNSLSPVNKGSVGSEILANVKRAFPMVSLDWLICGEGNMLTTTPTGGYVAKYEKMKDMIAKVQEMLSQEMK